MDLFESHIDELSFLIETRVVVAEVLALIKLKSNLIALIGGVLSKQVVPYSDLPLHDEIHLRNVILLIVDHTFVLIREELSGL